MVIKKITKELKECCTTIKNSLLVRKKYSWIKKSSPFTKMFLLCLKKKGLILGFCKVGESYRVELNVREGILFFNFHQGLGGRKVPQKAMEGIPHYSQGGVLMFSPKTKKIIFLEESYELRMGGVILGILLLG